MLNPRGYVFLAAIADFYFVSLAAGAVAAQYVAATRRPLPLGIAIVSTVVAFISSPVYHLRFARRTSWLSPGERMHGRVVVDGVKQWTNPWLTNRWAMFSLNLLALVLLGNAWDGLVEGRPTDLIQSVLSALYVLLVAVGLVALGQGQSGGAIGPALLYFVSAAAIFSAAPASAAPQSVRGIALVFVALGLLHILVIVLYDRTRRRRRLAALNGTLAADTGDSGAAAP